MLDEVLDKELDGGLDKGLDEVLDEICRFPIPGERTGNHHH